MPGPRSCGRQASGIRARTAGGVFRIALRANPGASHPNGAFPAARRHAAATPPCAIRTAVAFDGSNAAPQYRAQRTPAKS